MAKVKREAQAHRPQSMKNEHKGLDQGTRPEDEPWMASTWTRRQAGVRVRDEGPRRC